MGVGPRAVSKRGFRSLWTPRSLSLVAVCVQSSAVAIIMHASQLNQKDEKQHYKASSAVLVTEFGKLVLSSFLVIREIHAEKQKVPSSPAPEKTFLERESGISYRSLDVQLDPTQPSQKTYYPDPQHQLSQEQLLRAGTPPPSHLLIPIGSTQFSSSQSHALWNTSIAQEYFSRTFAPRWWLMAIPALFFCIQNNLIYVAARCLPVPVFQVTFQLKILITALCACLMLGRRLSSVQWLSLFFLGVGVATIQLSCRDPDHVIGAASHKHYLESSQMTGLAAVVVSCFCSAIAATYFELTLKRPDQTGHIPDLSAKTKLSFDRSVFETPTPSHRRAFSSTEWLEKKITFARQRYSLDRLSIHLPSALPTPQRSSFSSGTEGVQVARKAPSVWVRNVQLSGFSFILGLMVCIGETLAQEAASSPGWSYILSETITQPLYTEALIQHTASNFFAGFNGLVWVVVFIQCVGGLLTALVIKHADNVAKGFALSLSVLLTFVISLAFLDDFQLTFASFMGAVTVLATAFSFEQHKQVSEAARRFLQKGSRTQSLRWE